MSYNPIPPRVWSRVQNPCTFIVPGDQYLSSYIPLTGQTVSQAQADYEIKQLYKGNILQYKENSAMLTKSQKYSQLARCAGPNRRKVYATQSETYSNPNSTGLLKQNFVTYPFPNQLVGAPNNISGPFAYGIPNPDGCSGNSVQDGGTLVYGTYVNPCSNEVIKNCVRPATICNPASASNVPGYSFLCWNIRSQTWFPKPRYFMNNSTDKWPINYKGLVSAIDLVSSPILYGCLNTINSVILNWTPSSTCYGVIEKYIVNYSDGCNSFTSDVGNILSTIINGLISNTTYTFSVVGISSTGTTSKPSNSINIITTYQPFTYTGSPQTYYDTTNKIWSLLFLSTGSITFTQEISSDVFTVIVGGGGSGGKSGTPSGGEGGYQAVNKFSNIQQNSSFNITNIGTGGSHTNGAGIAGGNTSFSGPDSGSYIVTGGFPGQTGGGQVSGASYSGPIGTSTFTGGGGYGGAWSGTCSNTNGWGGDSYLLTNSINLTTYTGIHILNYFETTYGIFIGGGGGSGGDVGGEGACHRSGITQSGAGGASSCSINLNTQDALGYGGGGGSYVSGSVNLNRSGNGNQGLFILFFNYPIC